MAAKQGRRVNDRMKGIGAGKGGPLSVKTRAQRFRIQMYLRYRLSGESKWRKGTTENVSSSGVLFRGEQFAAANSILDMRLALPDQIPGVPSAQVFCRAVVVRSERPTGTESFPALATAISHYRFVRP
jgi:hypothetical protein